MNSVSQIKKLPLDALHRAAQAKMGVFGEWDVPLYYSSILDEHLAVRNQAGVFDISHMGELLVQGPQAVTFLDYVLPRNIISMPTGKALYSFFLNHEAGIIDDIIVYRLAKDEFLLIVNAGNVDKDDLWLRSLLSTNKVFQNGVKLLNVTDRMGLLAVQGPASESIVEKALQMPLRDLGYYRFKTWEGGFITRTGYTGEDGFEIMVDVASLENLWKELFEAGEPVGMRPCGFGARDTLRLEAGMLLHGHDMDETNHPLEAGLGWAIDFKKADFVGFSRLKEIQEKGYNKRIIGFEMSERGIPRPHCSILSENGETIGVVTSGSYCPYLKKNIGLGYVPKSFPEMNSSIKIEIRDKSVAANIVPFPFYKRAAAGR